MLDLKFVRDHVDHVKENVRKRHVNADPDRVVELYDQRNSVLRELEELRSKRNENAKRMKGKLSEAERQSLIEEGKRLKQEIPQREQELSDLEAQLNEEAGKLPNMTHPDVPLGEDDTANKERRRVGTPRAREAWMRDHVEIAQSLDLIDFETAAKVSGAKFYYLRNEAVFLEFALVRMAMDILTNRGFTPTITPDIARQEVAQGTGFNPRGPESNIYALENEDTCLIGTAEITLGGYHAGERFQAEQLPIRLAGFSHCFRREAGAAGQFSRGLYRVHQFSKVEMFVYALPEQSEVVLNELVAVEEEIFEKLEVPYRVVDVAAGDLGGPAYRKFDIEAWMPGRGDAGDYGEVTSASNCTDYQARRLNVRVKGEAGNRFVHMLNGTAVAVSRALVTLLENHQREDGSVHIPEALQAYTGFDRISK
ncbi:MAG: serine--tRNA ligase [Spirochaetes bacterium]|jgi:seryl-tRNA synthetase|nr:serine--tRNA ligase [Spirochaetota bacterium]